MAPGWKSFLLENGANFSAESVHDFGDTVNEAAVALQGGIVTDLSYLAVVAISGSDAENFLHGQFTGDILQLKEGVFQFSAWCDPKGRVIADFIIFKSEHVFYLLLPEDLKETFISRLRMYILRANVVIEDKSNHLVCIGTRGNVAIPALQSFFITIPEQPYQFTRHKGLFLLLLPDKEQRFVVLGQEDETKALWQALTNTCTKIGSRYWQLYDILTGLAWVNNETSGIFLAPDLKLEEHGGLSYSKGCFPGQEIIARLHYRGKEKKHLLLGRFSSDEPVVSGSKIVTDNLEKTVGNIVNTAGHPDSGIIALVCMDTDSHDTLYIKTPDDNKIALSVTTIE